jgi:hypothetical protein
VSHGKSQSDGPSPHPSFIYSADARMSATTVFAATPQRQRREHEVVRVRHLVTRSFTTLCGEQLLRSSPVELV